MTKTPATCERCVLLHYCQENNALKDGCKNVRLDPVPVDPDLMQEMRERMSV